MKLLWNVISVICGICAGILSISCIPVGFGRNMYGVEIPIHDPTVQIVDFSYTPASPVPHGSTLLFTARLNKPTDAGQVDVEIGDDEHLLPSPAYPKFVLMNDHGEMPDSNPGDGIWTGRLAWVGGYPDDIAGYPVTASIRWYDGHPGQLYSAPPLTVLPAEEAAQ